MPDVRTPQMVESCGHIEPEVTTPPHNLSNTFWSFPCLGFTTQTSDRFSCGELLTIC